MKRETEMTKSKQIRGVRNIWTKSDDAFLKKHYHYGVKLMACILNRNIYSIYNRANILGLRATLIKKITEEQIQVIRKNHGKLSYKEIGELVGRPYSSIRSLARGLGWKRTLEESQKIQDRCCKKTYFAKGHLPQNTKSDFEITIRTSHCGSNYKWIRLSVANWAILHVFNWEQANGPVPEGKILRNISGDTMDCTPKNWKLVDRAEHLDLNSGRSALENKYLANILTIRRKELTPIYLQMPEFLDLKRNELKLRRTINELAETSKTN